MGEEISDDNPGHLAEFVAKVGFCRTSEKAPFITGDPELKLDKQVCH